jgi:peptide/nickel transport system permease protein
MLDHFCRFFSVGAVSLPTFWVALFLQLIFFRWLSILPLGGQLDAKIKLIYEVPHMTGLLIFDSLITGNTVILGDAIKHILLPAITISLYPIGLVARMTRSSLLEILGEEYIKAARSYGLKENLVLWKYALKNSLGTTATVLALSIGYTLVNTFLVEAIFNWPGIGNYISSAVIALDYPAIIGVTLFSACSYVLLNLIADIIIALDPRVRA